MKEVFYTSRFRREAKHVPRSLRKLVEELVQLFKDDSFHHFLKTHKLKGSLKSFWAFSIDYQYRIIFEFADDGMVIFHSIGNHAIYD